MSGVSQAGEDSKAPRPVRNVRSEAVRLAKLGYPVFPCVYGKNNPATQHGFKDATTDIKILLNAINDLGDCNLGMSTENIVVMEVDDPDHQFIKEAERLGLAEVPHQRTSHGGRHYFFRKPEGTNVRSGTNVLDKNVDIRATGGYVVMAPSQVDSIQYRWERPLDCRPENLPDLPPWLRDALCNRERETQPREQMSPEGLPDTVILDRAARHIAKIDPAISGQDGHDTTFDAACSLVLGFNLTPEQAFTILADWNQKCQPPWSENELRHKLDDAARKQGERGFLLGRNNQPSESPPPESPSPQSLAIQRTKFSMKVYSCRELAVGDWSAEYYIDEVLAVGQPAIIAGAQKTLKTSIAADLMISVAMAKPFLGFHNVAKAAKCLFITGESGLAATQDTLRRVCASKGIRLEDCAGLHICADLPRFDNPDHLHALKETLADHETEIVAIDPAYLAMPGDKAENFFVQGQRLREVTEVCNQCGATMLLIHHISKGRTSYDPPELADMAWSGFSEFARQWILIGRRAKYEPGTGNHQLWLTVGGSLGHTMLNAIDIDEGLRTDLDGRRWEVTCLSAAEERRQQDKDRAAQEAKKVAQREADDRRKMLEALRQFPQGETKNALRERAGLRGPRDAEALRSLIGEGRAESFTGQKNGRDEEMYRPTGR